MFSIRFKGYSSMNTNIMNGIFIYTLEPLFSLLGSNNGFKGAYLKIPKRLVVVLLELGGVMVSKSLQDFPENLTFL